MWTYSQATGELKRNGATVGYGFSGWQDGINIPAMQDLAGLGPIPRGTWQLLDPPFDHPDLGPYALKLTPTKETQTFGRSGFWIHARSIKYPFSSSEGCLCLARQLRAAIWDSGDKLLEVKA